MQIETSRPHVWVTFQGKTKLVSEIDHQHLSNMYWYYLIFWDKKLQWVLDEINDRFNGQILHYRPHLQFESEIQGLEDRGMIRWTEETKSIMKVGVISFKDRIIGAIHQAI